MSAVDEIFNAHMLYEEDCSWERSFITQELFPELPISFFSHKKLQEVSFIGNPTNRIFVFTSNLHSFEDIKQVCDKIRPTIIVHCSDEWGGKPEFDELAKNCRLYLRQYRHVSYPKREGIKIMPLGYGVDMFNRRWSDTPIKPSHTRKNAWSFVGNTKSDREEIRLHFAALGAGFFGNADKDTMRNLYLESKFVPIGRGNVSLNCLRIYEALSAGAIPVVVGSDEEINATFFDENTDGWIFSNSWSEAAEKCKKLLEDAYAVSRKQQIALDGWRDRLSQLRKKIISKMKNNL